MKIKKVINWSVAFLVLLICFIFIVPSIKNSIKKHIKEKKREERIKKEAPVANYSKFRNKTRETHTAVKTGTRVFLKANWSLVPYGKIEAFGTNHEHFTDEPGVKGTDDHLPSGWYTFYPIGEKEVVFEIWQ